MSYEIKANKPYFFQSTEGVTLGRCNHCQKRKLLYRTKIDVSSFVDICKECKQKIAG